MARKSDSGSGALPDKSAAHLTVLRGKIDKLDLEILESLNERAAIAAQIGKVKADQGGEVFSAAREEEVLANVLQSNKGPLDVVTIKAIGGKVETSGQAVVQANATAIGSDGGAVAIEAGGPAVGSGDVALDASFIEAKTALSSDNRKLSESSV